MTHEEAYELLAALALDAVEPEEREELDRHVATCPRCRSELDSLRNVAATLGNSVEPLPEGLWSSISSRLYEEEGQRTPPLSRLMSTLQRPEVAIASRTRRAPLARVNRAGLALLAAAAVIITLGVGLASANHQVAHLQKALRQSSPGGVVAALSTPGHRLVNLKSASATELAQFVVLPDGRGYLVSSHLPALSSTTTYQLWAIERGKAISVGVLGRSPGQATFTMAGSPRPSGLAITVEPTGGSQTPSTTPIASGAIAS